MNINNKKYIKLFALVSISCLTLGLGNGTLVANASTTAKPEKVSFATLNSLNFNKADAISLFGNSVTVDSTNAGLLKAQTKNDLPKATKNLGKKKIASIDKVAKDLSNCSESGYSLPNIDSVVSPDFSFILKPKYVFLINSQIFPTSGDGETKASNIVSSPSCLKNAMNSFFKVGLVGTGSELKITNVSIVNNSIFPAGTHAIKYEGKIIIGTHTLPVFILQIVSGKGNKLASYILYYTQLSTDTVGNNTFSDASTAFENLISKKISSISRTTL